MIIPNFIDIAGQRFGLWTVLKRVDNIEKNPAWLCKRNCGTERIVLGISLRSGRSKSCGCSRSVQTGNKFGFLTAVKKLYYNEKRANYMWLCKCDCGNEKITCARELLAGDITSCGCMKGKWNKKFNKYDLKDTLGIGITSNNSREFYFDIEDYDKIKNHCWYMDKNGYIKTRIDGSLISLHQIIMGKVDGFIIDHINRAPHDNRKENLRVATKAQNVYNSFKPKGFHYVKQTKKIPARIAFNKQTIHLGYFDTEQEAYNAYMEAKKKYAGEFFPIEQEGTYAD